MIFIVTKRAIHENIRRDTFFSTSMKAHFNSAKWFSSRGRVTHNGKWVSFLRLATRIRFLFFHLCAGSCTSSASRESSDFSLSLSLSFFPSPPERTTVAPVNLIPFIRPRPSIFIYTTKRGRKNHDVGKPAATRVKYVIELLSNSSVRFISYKR